MTKEEFEEYYGKNSKVGVEWIREHMIAKPCDCGEERCQGWQMTSKKAEEFMAKLEAEEGTAQGEPDDSPAGMV